MATMETNTLAHMRLARQDDSNDSVWSLTQLLADLTLALVTSLGWGEWKAAPPQNPTLTMRPQQISPQV